MKSFKTQEELDAYTEYVVGVASENFKAMGLGPRTREMSLVVPPPTGPWAVPATAASEGGKLILTGASGTGKTTLLKRILWGLCLRRYKPRGGYIPNVFFNLKSGDTKPYMDWLTSGDLLVLDDLDKLRGTQFEGQCILNVLNHYDVNRLPIISTMNIDFPSFRTRMVEGGIPSDYADAIISRLQGNLTTHLMVGEDHRSPK